MNSIENILNYIKNNTKEEIEKIKNENLKQCEKILKDLEIIKQQEIEKTKEKIKTKKNELKNMFKIELNQIEKKELCCKKDEILKKVINLAVEKLCTKNLEQYFNLTEKLLKKNIPKESFELIFGEKDYENFEKYFSKDFLQNLTKKTKIKFSKNFIHGFIILCEKYNLNFKIEQMFLENMLKLKNKAINALNLKENLFWKKTIIFLLQFPMWLV